jgi:hypothetical protein
LSWKTNKYIQFGYHWLTTIGDDTKQMWFGGFWHNISGQWESGEEYVGRGDSSRGSGHVLNLLNVKGQYLT